MNEVQMGSNDFTSRIFISETPTKKMKYNKATAIIVCGM
jgi:hypothetical protein